MDARTPVPDEGGAKPTPQGPGLGAEAVDQHPLAQSGVREGSLLCIEQVDHRVNELVAAGDHLASAVEAKVGHDDSAAAWRALSVPKGRQQPSWAGAAW